MDHGICINVLCGNFIHTAATSGNNISNEGKLDLSANDMVLEGKNPACHMMCPPKHINLVRPPLWPSVLGRLGRNRGVIHLEIEAQSVVKVRIIVSCKL